MYGLEKASKHSMIPNESLEEVQSYLTKELEMLNKNTIINSLIECFNILQNSHNKDELMSQRIFLHDSIYKIMEKISNDTDTYTLIKSWYSEGFDGVQIAQK